MYVDVSIDAAKLLESSTDEILQIALDYLRHNRSPNIIAGEDSEEMLMSKAQIRNGHSGTSTTLNTSAHGQESAYSSMSALLESLSSSPSISNTRNTTTNATTNNKNESWFDRPFHLWSTEDKFLLCGAVVVQTLREDVFRQLGFTCSAGVAANKKLAKIASGMHKPNKQTLVPGAVVRALMRALPYSRVQGFGGKLGQALNEKFGDRVQTLGDLLEK